MLLFSVLLFGFGMSGIGWWLCRKWGPIKFYDGGDW